MFYVFLPEFFPRNLTGFVSEFSLDSVCNKSFQRAFGQVVRLSEDRVSFNVLAIIETEDVVQL